MKGQDEDGCRLERVTPNEMILLSALRNPDAWLDSLEPPELEETLLFLLGRTPLVPRCLSELGFKSRVVAAPMRFQPAALVFG